MSVRNIDFFILFITLVKKQILACEDITILLTINAQLYSIMLCSPIGVLKVSYVFLFVSRKNTV